VGRDVDRVVRETESLPVVPVGPAQAVLGPTAGVVVTADLAQPVVGQAAGAVVLQDPVQPVVRAIRGVERSVDPQPQVQAPVNPEPAPIQGQVRPPVLHVNGLEQGVRFPWPDAAGLELGVGHRVSIIKVKSGYKEITRGTVYRTRSNRVTKPPTYLVLE